MKCTQHKAVCPHHPSQRWEKESENLGLTLRPWDKVKPGVKEQSPGKFHPHLQTPPHISLPERCLLNSNV